MRTFRNTNAVSEAIGEILLLAIAVTSIAVLYSQISHSQGPQDITNVTIIGKMEQGAPVFELQRGESLSADTKIYITVAGYEQKIFSLNQSQGRGHSTNNWHIGERIILPKEDITGLQVEATIVDQKTNSIVFWGMLQDGFVLPARGKGGIWHFDESSWNQVPNEVKDSSENGNHGIARNGAKILNGTTEPFNVKNINAGFFDGINDYIRVDTSWTLNVTDTMTLEAWMKPLYPQPIIDKIELEEKFGYTPYIIPLHDEVYVVISEDQAKGGVISTVEITETGNVTYLHHYYFGSSTSQKNLRPMMIQCQENIVLVAYIDAQLYIHLKTMHVSTDYNISPSGYELVYKDYKSSNNIPNRPSLVKITDNLYAIAYWAYMNGAQPQAGFLRTLRVMPDGNIIDTGVNVYYDSVVGFEPCLIHMDQDVYALAYRGLSNLGILKTFTINPTGAVAYTGQTVQFESGQGFEPSLIKISDTVCAVVYRQRINNNKHYGSTKTFNISKDGSIASTGKNAVFEQTINCFNPYITSFVDDLYIITYATGNSGSTQGYYISIKLLENGSIYTVADSKKQFDPSRCYNPMILHCSEHLFAIVYEGFGDHPGKLFTVYIGQETFPPYRGIFKKDSYGIFANDTIIVGSINNVMVTHPNTPGWHHFAVSYDGMMIRLYVDGYLVNSTLYENHRISKTRNDLYFGRYYYGIIDEIALHDKVLTQDQILTHFKNPGMLE